jgi:hypothetical protein
MRGLALVVALLLSFTVQAAKQSPTPNRFGAIAYERASKSWGISYDKTRARDAELEALRQCGGKRCVVVHKFKNGCAALVDGPNAKSPAAASGATRDEAETKALKRCGTDCAALAWGCTR